MGKQLSRGNVTLLQPTTKHTSFKYTSIYPKISDQITFLSKGNKVNISLAKENTTEITLLVVDATLTDGLFLASDLTFQQRYDDFQLQFVSSIKDTSIIEVI